MKNLTIYIFALFVITSCRQKKEHSDNKAIQTNFKSTNVKTQSTDSVLLLKHLDSLSKINFPFKSEFNNREFLTVIDLHEFKNKKLFNLPFKRIEREAGGGLIDYNTKDSTFNLTDNNFKAQWNLISKNPKFLVLEVYADFAFFVTITYDLKVIDAIRSGYVSGNAHWLAERHSIINKDLTIKLQHYYEVQTDEKYNYDSGTTEEKWFIDNKGFFKQK
jgi:hypothetical protein